MDVDAVERDIAHVVEAGHDHAGDPEGDDVAAGGQNAGGVIAFEVGGGVGPSKGAMGPEGALGEPGVQNVGVLDEDTVFFQGGDDLGVGGLADTDEIIGDGEAAFALPLFEGADEFFGKGGVRFAPRRGCGGPTRVGVRWASLVFRRASRGRSWRSVRG